MSASTKCSNPGCEKAGKKRCSQCQSVFYCDEPCQRSNWKEHRPKCKAIEKQMDEKKKKLPEEELAEAKATLGSSYSPQFSSHSAKKKSIVRNGFFYPNLGGVRNCEVTNGVTINTTNDLGAYCDEVRSFMDYDFFKATFGDTITLVKPQPRCKEVRGVRFAQPCKVIGMIPQLSVRIGKDPKGPTVLKGVLVVENFCVPLHLGLKNDRLDNVSEEVDVWGSRGVKNAPEHFPPKYRSHSHWQPSDIYYLGGPLSEVMMTDSESEDEPRDQLAKKYGWVLVDNTHAGTESWVKDGNRIDYYPNTDRCKTTLKDHPKDATEAGHCGNPHNKDLVRDNVGGNTGLEEIFKNLRVHSGSGRYHK